MGCDPLNTCISKDIISNIINDIDVGAQDQTLEWLRDNIANNEGTWGQFNVHIGRLEGCAKLDQFKSLFNSLVEAIDSYDEILNLVYDISSDPALIQALVDLGEGDPESWYQVGRATAFVGSFFTGVGAITKIAKIKAILEALKRGANIDEFIALITRFINLPDDIPSLTNILRDKYPNLSQEDLAKLIMDFNTNPDILKRFIEEPELLEGWRALDNHPNLRNDIGAIEYLTDGRGTIIRLDVEEVLGGHSIARHGAHLSDQDMRLRALGIHPTLPPTKKSLKFDSDDLHQNSVQAAYEQYLNEIQQHFANGGGPKDWVFDFGSTIGRGYQNLGTNANPNLIEVTSTKVKIVFVPDPNSPGGFKLLTAFPCVDC